MWGWLLIAGAPPPSRVTLISASTPHLRSYEIPSFRREPADVVTPRLNLEYRRC